jgi:NAD(P)-dependent dehydrogenase (short-subunit alcohol dehydrogenase family)
MSILDLFRLDGQVALVTGATRGIGLGIAEAFADAGARLVLSSKNPRPEVIEKLRAGGRQIDYISADMQDEAEPSRLVADTLKLTGGRLDILVNNAGIAQHGDTETFSAENLKRIMDVNFNAVFRMCQAALTPMLKQRSGVICNISSISGLLPMYPQPQAAYNASKAAVNLLTKSIASDHAKDGIRANAIAPGYIATDMTAGGFANPEWGPVWTQMTPMPKVGAPSDIGAAAVYLCSPASGYVTGEVLVVDGGYTIR